MTREDEITSLRKLAAELIEKAGRRANPLSPEQDADILALLNEAEELEHQEHSKPHSRRAYCHKERTLAAGAFHRMGPRYI
jgi:hypothetical protein